MKLTDDQIKALESQYQKDKATAAPPPARDRITVVESVYHHVHDHQVTEYGSKFSEELESAGKPALQVRCDVGESWQMLIDIATSQPANCSQLLVKSLAGRYTTVYPTADERAIEEAKVLEVCCFDSPDLAGIKPQWLIYPRKSMRGQPSDVRQLMIRCRKGAASYLVTLIPE